MEKDNKLKVENLRQKAEMLRKNSEKLGASSKTTALLSESAMLRLIQELEIHQIELELQNIELQRANASAEIATMKYSDLYDFSPSGYLTISREGNIIELNLTSAKMFGKVRSVIKNSKFDFFVSTDTRTGLNRFVDKIFESKGHESCEVTLIKDDNISTHVLLNGIITENEELCSVNMVDITERKNSAIERDRLMVSLETKNSEIEQFIYTVTHDLKSPLVTINGFVGLLAKDANEGNETRIAEDIQYISNASSSMDVMLTELLEFSRVGRLDNPHEKIIMNELVNEVVQLLQGSILASKANIKIQPHLPNVIADRPRIKALLQNIIENAIKFMGDQAQPRIEIAAHTEANQTVYTIKDNGIGIAKPYQEKVFGLFEHLDPEVLGTGMGLALVKRIVGVHNGRAWLESDGEGCGCTLFFTLPQQKEIL